MPEKAPATTYASGPIEASFRSNILISSYDTKRIAALGI
eukprot:CAMPEP_0182539754 /NCGR_PEP_ID=MMETSP1323-20130603/25901_1 /TAXON_ID=236787 /ORGANISM="Florenciella parvula, Strain RCC1693" /LENGTH=38 /DNA_ID= /DNA_START= /DNA_END= /DNA_ORIENTATION=